MILPHRLNTNRATTFMSFFRT